MPGLVDIQEVYDPPKVSKDLGDNSYTLILRLHHNFRNA